VGLKANTLRTSSTYMGQHTKRGSFMNNHLFCSTPCGARVIVCCCCCCC
jgi:hypothetical protein